MSPGDIPGAAVVILLSNVSGNMRRPRRKVDEKTAAQGILK
jgi:hypothetical protein